MMVRFRRLALLLAGSVSLLPGFGWAADGAGYRLGPQDKLEVRVYDVRTGSGEAHQWTALNGEFYVDATGSVSLPLLGEVPAGTGTAGDLAESIAARLQAKIGLAQRPDASVQVIKYRPFYIMGAVDKPGEYEYRPGLTILQALSTAGGMFRATDQDLIGLERDALTQRGDLRVLEADHLALSVRQARLDAEIADADGVTFPVDIKAREGEPDVSRAMREEQLLFTSRRNTLKSQTDAIQQAKTLLNSELTSLAAKDVSLAHQLDLTRKELSQITDLVGKGLAVMPRQLAAEQSAAAFESNRLDVQLATLRAQQDLARANRDIIDLRAKRRDEALTEAAEVGAKLSANLEKSETDQELIYHSEVRAPMAITRTATPLQPTFVLTRQSDNGPQTRTVTENDLVEPGDVVRVIRPQRNAPSGPASKVSEDLPNAEAADASPDASIRR